METDQGRSIVAIDPGNAKCGLVFLAENGERVVERSVVPTTQLVSSLSTLLKRHPAITTIVMGSGTGSGSLAKAIRSALPEIKLLKVDEVGTSLLARERYWQENPPQGWRKILPRTLLTPSVPIDDYAALLLAERYLAAL